MAVVAVKHRAQMRRLMVISVKRLYRSICNHPFLFGFLCFLLLLYRSFPFAFSLLVSASPVIVCTAILLGTLLSFGQPNIPELEKEEKVTSAHDTASLKTAVLEDNTVVARDEYGDFATVERYVEKARGIVEGSTDEASLLENRASEAEEDVGSVDYMPLLDESTREINFEERGIDVAEREFDDLELEKRNEMHEEKARIELKLNEEEVIESFLSKDRDQNITVEDNKSKGEFADVHNEDKMGSDPGSAWKRVGEDSTGENGDDGSYDSESDGAESSSPDASMADIIPMLDELHPLLDLEAPQHAQTLHDGSEATSLRSRKSDDEIEDDNDDGDEDDEDEEEEEDGEEEEAKGEKDDESKSAIKWTEVDQRNLMDLGTSELERNQRLENLIARRRARKSMRLMAEKNLIDLESSDLSFNIPPISTTRRNPFELPDDTYDNMALPGSAPSILLPRRNPFDIPYDANEEKPDLKGDSFQQEFTAFQNKEPVFRRNETFTMGPSVLGGPKLERQDFRWRPYFVPERFSSDEGTSYPSFERQLSEISESKVSSVPDTESMSSAVDEEDRKRAPEQVASDGPSNTSALHRQTSEISESKASSVLDSESLNSAVDEEDKKLSNDIPQETDVISGVDHVVDPVERRSISSDDLESADRHFIHRYQDEITLGDVENPHHMESSLSESGAQTTPQETTNEFLLPAEQREERSSSRSSLSSLSELDEKIPDVKDGSTSLEQKDDHSKESGVTARSSGEESEPQFTSGAVEHKDPVYDSSPHGIEKFLSFSSSSSDTQLALSDKGSPTVSLKPTDKESEVHVESEERDASCSGETNKNQSTGEEITVREKMGSPAVLLKPTDKESEVLVESKHKDTSGLGKTNKNQSIVEEIVVRGKHNVHDVEKVGSSSVSPSSEVQRGSTASLFSLDSGSPEDFTVYRGDIFHPERGELASTSRSVGKLDSADNSFQITAADSSLLTAEGQHNTRANEVESLQPSVSSPKIEQVEEQAGAKKKKDQLERNEADLPTSSDKAKSVNNQNQPSSAIESDKVVYGDPSNKSVPSEVKSPKLDKQPSGSDKSMTEPHYDDLDEPKEVPALLTEALEVVNTNNKTNESGAPRAKTLETFFSIVSEFNSTPFQSPEYGSPGAEITRDEILEGIVYEDCIEEEVFSYSVEAQEIKELDEGLLSELDNVGDFSVKEVGGESLPSGSKTKEIKPEIPVIEAKSIQDIELTFKQLHEGAEVEEVILPSMLEDQVATDRAKTPAVTDPGLPVVEARSVEDIHAVMKQVSVGYAADRAESSECKDLPAEVKEHEQQVKFSSEVEAGVKEKSECVAGDINVVSENKQVSEDNMTELSKPLELANHYADVKENEAKSFSNEEPSVIENRGPVDANTIRVSEKTSVVKQVSEANMADPSKLSESKEQMAEVKENDVLSGQHVESGNKEKNVTLDGEMKDMAEETSESKQVSEGIMAELSEPLEPKDPLSEVKGDDAVPNQQIKTSSDVESDVRETKVNPAGDAVPNQQIKTSSDVESDVRETKANTAGEVSHAADGEVNRVSESEQVSEGNVNLPRSSDSKKYSAEVKENSSNVAGELKHVPQEISEIKQVSEHNVELPKSTATKDRSPEVKEKNPTVTGELNVPVETSEKKQVSEGRTEILQSTESKDRSSGAKEKSSSVAGEFKHVPEKASESKQISEATKVEVLEASASKEHSAIVKEPDVISTEQVKPPSDVESGVQKNSLGTASELKKHGSEGTSDNSSLSTSEDKKA